MATLLREIERPAFVDAPHAGQLSLAGPLAPARAREGGDGTGRAPLSERLRCEQAAGLDTTKRSRTTVLRRGGEATLDEMLVGAWEGLSVHRPVACPVCSGTMAPRSEAAGGACGDCGVQLR